MHQCFFSLPCPLLIQIHCHVSCAHTQSMGFDYVRGTCVTKVIQWIPSETPGTDSSYIICWSNFCSMKKHLCGCQFPVYFLGTLYESMSNSFLTLNNKVEKALHGRLCLRNGKKTAFIFLK